MDTQVLKGIYAVQGYCDNCGQDTDPLVFLPLTVMNVASMMTTIVFVGALCPVCHYPNEKEMEFDDPDQFYAKYDAMKNIHDLLQKHEQAGRPIYWPTDEMHLSYDEEVVIANAARFIAERWYRQKEYYLPRLAMDHDWADAIGSILDK
jgi:hypothetical protein